MILGMSIECLLIAVHIFSRLVSSREDFRPLLCKKSLFRGSGWSWLVLVQED